LNGTISTIKSKSDIKVVYTDLFDTLIHRTVHPHNAFKLWCKHVIRELGLSLTEPQLYKIRMAAADHLSLIMGAPKVEIAYERVIEEIHKRLINGTYLDGVDFQTFYALAKEADFMAEASVQFLNDTLVNGLRHLKENGYEIVIISDFHLPKDIIMRLLEHHDIVGIFDAVFISCDLGTSKETGTIYPQVLQLTSSTAKETAMMGDHKISDYIHAQSHGLFAQHLKHRSHKFRNKRNLFGSEKKQFLQICKKTVNNCAKSKHPFSEYIVHFYFFTERLYAEAKRKGIKDLFFLAREGLFLKQLFDHYQETNTLDPHKNIRTHYFKASRHSAMQVSLETLDKETFAHLKRKYDHMSLRQFLESFEIKEDIALAISEELQLDLDAVINNFVTSDTMTSLRKNKRFTGQYDRHRLGQRKAFDAYLGSFQIDFEKDGIALVDVGWGGTMQECIYDYLDGKVAVTGYYIGLREIYNIQEKTKRFGLNFSVYPKKGFSDQILLANGQLYEQLLAAPHGSTIGYDAEREGYALEYHEENEKKVFDTFIAPIQSFMMEQFDILCADLKQTVYSQKMVQDYITDLALRLGLFTNGKKIKFIHQISQGFYQNMGNNKVGIVYDPKAMGISKKQLVKDFIWAPEKTFRYLVKLKPYLAEKRMGFLGGLVGVTYYYIKFNRWFKAKFLSKQLL
jgi:predicted HAD superfamily hydrolase